MDLLATYDDIPWELIAASLHGDLPDEENRQLQQWIDLAPGNREKYEQLRRLWHEGLADYDLYRKANEGTAWQSLAERIGNSPVQQEKAKIVRGSFNKQVKYWMVAAAVVLILMAGAGYWFFSGPASTTVYATNGNEQKKISLPDGSTIVLQPLTHIQFAQDYDREGRTVVLNSGEAFFEVQHNGQRPFIVDMDAVSVKDIGTSFTIQKMKDSIKVIVFSGKVAFIKNGTGEARELSAGSSLCFYVDGQRFGEIRPNAAMNSGNKSLLNFDNVPLSDVIAVLQKVYGKTIRLNDTGIAQKRFNANLDGESFDNAINVICTSFNLQYIEQNGVYVFIKKDTAAGK